MPNMEPGALDACVQRIANFPVNCTPSPYVFAELEGLFTQLELAMQTEIDPFRLPRFLELASFTRPIFLQILRLRKSLVDGVEVEINERSQETYQALSRILRLSFEDEIRKMESALGLVHAVADLLILHVNVYELSREKVLVDTIKAVGNTLTNLTFGNTQSKKRLCAHFGFLEEVTRIIGELPEMTQAYAALIRNLSWHADQAMTRALQKTVAPLAAAAVRLCKQRQEKQEKPAADKAAAGQEEAKCLLATFAALWNLAGHSADNKRAICDTPDFLRSLVAQLNNEPENTVFVENASGVLKYISGCYVNSAALLKAAHEAKVVRHLLDLLNSSSFTVIINALGALCPLVARDERTQMRILNSEQAGLVLESLKNSAQEDVRTAAKTVLSHLNSSHLAGFAMTMPAKPGRFNYFSGTKGMSCSYGEEPVPGQKNLLQRRMQNGQNSLSRRPEKDFCTLRSKEPSPKIVQNAAAEAEPLELQAGSGLTDSTMATRTGSFQSLSEDVPANWKSNITTTRNSGNQSPSSPSDLPDSPSHYSRLSADEDEAAPPHRFFAPDEEPAAHPAATPPARAAKKLLDSAIASVLPKPKRLQQPNGEGNKTAQPERMLDRCIANVIPKPRSQGRRLVEGTGDELGHELGASGLDQMKNSSLLIHPSTMEKVRDASNLAASTSAEPDRLSEDNFQMLDLPTNGNQLPYDVDFELSAERIEIDCLTLPRTTRNAWTALAKGHSTMSRLPEPRRLPPPKSSARVSPFNYRSPEPPKPPEKPGRRANGTKFGEFTLANL